MGQATFIVAGKNRNASAAWEKGGSFFEKGTHGWQYKLIAWTTSSRYLVLREETGQSQSLCTAGKGQRGPIPFHQRDGNFDVRIDRKGKPNGLRGKERETPGTKRKLQRECKRRVKHFLDSFGGHEGEGISISDQKIILSEGLARYFTPTIDGGKGRARRASDFLHPGSQKT